MANDEIQEVIEKIEAKESDACIFWTHTDDPHAICNSGLVVNDLKALTTANRELQTRLESAETRLTRYDNALTPSTATKGAYIGEFSWQESFEEGGPAIRTVPWTTIKEIMATIRERATREHKVNDRAT